MSNPTGGGALVALLLAGAAPAPVAGLPAAERPIVLRSPGAKLEVDLTRAADGVAYTVRFAGKPLIERSPLASVLDLSRTSPSSSP